ncbi:hypothetical protein E2I00_009956, partial [Balaenoptera physalus]
MNLPIICAETLGEEQHNLAKELLEEVRKELQKVKEEIIE